MTEHGLVVARHRFHVTVEAHDGARYLCRTGKRRLQPLIGDEVAWVADGEDTGIVNGVHERRTTLSRIDSRGRCELVAANLTRLFAVAAAEPPPDWLVVDHYLVAAELAGLAGAIVFNKVDLAAAGPPEHLGCYRRAGYAVHLTSAVGGAGLSGLASAMQGERSVVVGQSGVGKSSLLNALVGDALQSIGELSAKGAHGRHTTSSAVLHRLANGGELIDAPGVRAYAPYIEDPVDLQHGFREFRARLGECRFDNCRHLAEPDCAVKAAVDDETICRLRYESYERLYDVIASLKAKRER